MVKEEWKNLLGNKILLLVILVIAAIPAIYAGLFLASMWDPYGNVNQLPVAVVNQDKSVKYQDTTLKIGENLVSELQKNDSLSFHFVNQKEASAGLRDGTYYMVITIPKDFSKNAATLMDEKPKKMELQYETNPGTNYIASKLGETALARIKTTITAEVTKTYTKSIFAEISAAGDGMQKATEGALSMKSGMNDAVAGNEVLTANLKKLSDSTLTFTEGADSLAVGLKAYTDGVAQLDQSSTALTNGANQLTAGTQAYIGGTNQLALGAKQLQPLEQLGSVYTGITQLNQAVPQLQTGTKQLQDGLFSLNTQLGVMAADTDAGGNLTLVGGIKSAASGMTTASEGMAAASTGMTTAADGITTAGGICTKVSGALERMPLDTSRALSGYGAVVERAFADGNDKINTANGQITAGKEQVSAALAQLLALQSSGQPITADSLNGVIGMLAAADGSLGGVAQLDTASYSGELQQISNEVDLAATENAGQLRAAKTGLEEIAGALLTGAEDMKRGAGEMSTGQQSMSAAAEKLVTGIGTLQESAGALYVGAQAVNTGMEQAATGLLELQTKTAAFPEAGAGMKALNNGFATLQANDAALLCGAQALGEGIAAYTSGVAVINSNSNKLTTGAWELLAGAGQLKDGSTQLYDGAGQLGDGLGILADGSGTLSDSLSAGAAKIKAVRATTDTADMFATPVVEKESKMTEVANNGHAMAPYMMSVGLWVGSLAFCLMYPLTKYHGT